MNKKIESFKIPLKWVISNWITTILFGSFLFAFIYFFLYQELSLLGFINSLILGGGAFLGALIFSIPSLFLMLFFGYLLNKRELTFGKYVVYQNTTHFIVAILSFGYSNLYDFVYFDFVPIECMFFCYLIAGFIVWNKMYFDLRRLKSI